MVQYLVVAIKKTISAATRAEEAESTGLTAFCSLRTTLLVPSYLVSENVSQNFQLYHIFWSLTKPAKSSGFSLGMI